MEVFATFILSNRYLQTEKKLCLRKKQAELFKEKSMRY